MATRPSVWGLALLLAGIVFSAEEKRFSLDRCIAERCKNGRFVSVGVTDDWYAVRIDPNYCRGSGYTCSTSYEAFSTEDGTPARVSSYELGTKSSVSFTVYVPRPYETLYIHGINGTDRDATLDLRPFGGTVPRPRRGKAAASKAPAAPPVRAGVDDLFESFAAAYDALDARAMAELFTDDALYMGPEGGIVYGRSAIRDRFASFFDWVREQNGQLEISFASVDREIEVPLAYDVGYYTLVRKANGETTTERGKFAIVLRLERDAGWRIHVDSYSPAPSSLPLP